MRNEEWVSLFKIFPESEHSKLVVVLSSGTEIAIERLFRLEPTFACIRGRLAGTEDTGRLFFTPYTQMTYLKIDRVVKESEVARIFGETVDEETLARERAEEFGIGVSNDAATQTQPTVPGSAPTPAPSATPVTSATPTPTAAASEMPAATPAAAGAANSLLEKLRQAKAAVNKPLRPGGA